jgi:hypothetical protein
VQLPSNCILQPMFTAVQGPNNTSIESLADFGNRRFEFGHRYLCVADGTIFFLVAVPPLLDLKPQYCGRW